MMNITFTERAKEKLESALSDQQAGLKILYDTEGCGCGVDGIFVLTAHTEVEAGEIEIESDYRAVWIDAHKEVFFDEKMKVDYKPDATSFILSSNQQILNPRMRFIKEIEA
ncbi:iron-sulfur cluster biosynthesis family protein [Bacillus tianshenii]|nr:iron-sulfur cluster biosynthesis family protein [Bacillus tianshenii]